METKPYNTRLKRKLLDSSEKSRVDWKRTKRDSISQVLDSDESFTSEEEELEETSEESDDSSCTDDAEDQKDETTLPEEDGEEQIKKPRLKSKSAMIDSESSSDSDGPGERVHVRRRCAIKEDDSDEGKESEDEQTKAHAKKQRRLEMLRKLADRQKSRGRTTSQEATEESSQDVTPEADFTSQDSDDLSDFIVEDEEENNQDQTTDPTPSYKELFRKHHISTSESYDLSSHLQKVVRAFLINIIDDTFLTTLYEGVRRKRYAREMLKSLNYLDERIIGPRLEKLTASCRWTKRYKERINCYPDLYVKSIPAEEMTCEACELHRTCSCLVVLSGQAYDHETLEYDDFLQDNKQKLVTGTVCASRTEAYHQLRHYKYFLYQRCMPFIDETKERSAKEMVELALSEMETKGFLDKEVLFLEGYLNEADYFQDERKDSLIS